MLVIMSQIHGLSKQINPLTALIFCLMFKKMGSIYIYIVRFSKIGSKQRELNCDKDKAESQ